MRLFVRRGGALIQAPRWQVYVLRPWPRRHEFGWRFGVGLVIDRHDWKRSDR